MDGIPASSSAAETPSGTRRDDLIIGKQQSMEAYMGAQHPSNDLLEYSREDLYRSRVERFALKSVVDALFPYSSTAKCFKRPIPGQSIRILKSISTGNSFVSGLMHCSSVWCCPVCASKISERRKQQLQQAISDWINSYNYVYLLTLTIPHRDCDSLKKNLKSMLVAWHALVSSWRYKVFRKEIGVAGIIRTLEVTWGVSNGWHPHLHALMFTYASIAIYAVRDEFFCMWRHEIIKAGLNPTNIVNGVRVDDGSHAAGYVCESESWGFAGEITKSHIKSARGRFQFSAWDFLRFIRQYPNTPESFKAFGLFSDYVAAFSGCRQLHYSTGLKKILGIDGSTDAELNAAWEDSAFVLVELDYKKWSEVCASGTLPRLLHVAECAPQHLQEYLHL